MPRAACLAWMTSYRTPLFFAQGVGRVVRARGRHESATVFLPAVRPLLALAAELEDERNHVIPPPAAGDDQLLDVEPVEPEPGERRRLRAGRRRRRRSRTCCTPGARSSPRRELTDATTRTSSGCPASCRPEQMAQVLARRDEHARKRAGRVEAAAAVRSRPPRWRAGARAAPRGEPPGRRRSPPGRARRTARCTRCCAGPCPDRRRRPRAPRSSSNAATTCSACSAASAPERRRSRRAGHIRAVTARTADTGNLAAGYMSLHKLSDSDVTRTKTNLPGCRAASPANPVVSWTPNGQG